MMFKGIFTQTFLIESGIRIFLLGTLFCQWVQELLIFHKFNLYRFSRNCNWVNNSYWVNAPIGNLSKALMLIITVHYRTMLVHHFDANDPHGLMRR